MRRLGESKKVKKYFLNWDSINSCWKCDCPDELEYVADNYDEIEFILLGNPTSPVIHIFEMARIGDQLASSDIVGIGFKGFPTDEEYWWNYEVLWDRGTSILTVRHPA